MTEGWASCLSRLSVNYYKNMIIKTYKAKTNVSINVVLTSKKNLHISFVPLSDGSSVFTTDNTDVQRAIESHYNFGRLFRLKDERRNLKNEEVAPETVAMTKEENENPKRKDAVDEDGGTGDDVLRKVHVSDISTARDYLADTFGVSRTAMRNTKSILEKAVEYGIEFVGL